MPSYTEEQKRIAMLLMHAPKTAEELNNQLNIPFNRLSEELAAMLKMNVVEKEGFPTKYRLKKNISEELARRKQIAETDFNKLRIRAYVEMQAIETELLERQATKLEETMRKDKSFTLYTLEKATTEKHEEYFSTYFDINFSVKDFASLVRFMFFYGPTSIEVLKPSKIEFSAQDLQDGLLEMADMVQKYSTYIQKLLNRQELEKFHKDLFQ